MTLNTRFILVVVLQFLVSVVFSSEKAPLYHYQKKTVDNQEIHFLEIDPHDYKIIAVNASQTGNHREPVSALVKHHSALAGINGGFFQEDGSPFGVLKIAGEWYGLANIPRGAIGWDLDSQKVLMDRVSAKRLNSKKVVVDPLLDKRAKTKAAWQQMDTIIAGIPLLMKDGKTIDNYAVEKPSDSFIHDKHARTAVCIKDNDHWLFVVVSHIKTPVRPYVSTVIEGLTIAELSQILKEQGCHHAVNLDGGGSATLVINDKVMNRFAGDYDETKRIFVERPVANAILILAR